MFSNSSGAFYFATIRKLSVAFGSLFNNVYIQRFDQPGGKGNVIRTIKVPLSYAAGEKWYTHRTQDIPATEGVQKKMTLPRIGFELTGMQYDANRQTNVLNKITKVDETDVTNFLRTLNPVPYDFSFEVQIAIKNIDDGLQIIEQIVPYFQPSFSLNIKDIPELQIVRDVPVILGDISFTDTYEGSYDETRTFIWTLTFVTKAYLYPPIQDSDIIRKVIANVYKDKELSKKQGVVTVQVDPITADYDDDGWQVKTNIFDETQLDSNGGPIVDSNGNPIV